MKMINKPLARTIAIALSASSVFYGPPVLAQSSGDTQQEINALKQQVQLLLKKVDELSSRQTAATEKQEKIEKQVATQATSKGSAISALKNIEFYGNLDISLDEATKGIAGKIANNGVDTPVGKVGWLPAISTNLSYLGLRGKHDLGNGLAAVMQNPV